MSPCAACKLLRRRCAKGCVFAPYFPPDEPQKFANVHKVFGASNVNKMLKVMATSCALLKTFLPKWGCLPEMFLLSMQLMGNSHVCFGGEFTLCFEKSGPSSASTWRCCELHGLWGQCSCTGPSLWVCGCHFVPTTASHTLTVTIDCGKCKDSVLANAPG